MGRTSFSGMKRTKVLLADDHKIVLDGLRNLLEPEFMLIGAVEDGRALLFAVQQLHPDVIVVDISMPLLNGIDAVRQIKKIDNQVKVIFLTMHADVTYAIRAFEVGASGYVLKHASSSELRIAIHAAIKGQTYVSPKEIANILNISSRTVEFHKHNVMLKLKLKTNSGLIKYAIKNGFTAVEGLKDGISS
jgi:DNA-binding NarL/FixJ family response regulator